MDGKYYGHAVISDPGGWFYLVMYLTAQCTLSKSVMLAAWRGDGTFIKLDNDYLEELVGSLECAVAAMEIEWGEDAPIVKRMQTIIAKVRGDDNATATG